MLYLDSPNSERQADDLQKNNLQPEQVYQNCKHAHGNVKVETTVQHPPSFAVHANVSTTTKVLKSEQLFSGVHI